MAFTDTVATALAAGRAAFWNSQRICINPQIGKDARLWSKGWRDAEADFCQRSGQPPMPRSCGRPYPARLLTPYRPADILVSVRGRPRMTQQQRGKKGSRIARRTAGDQTGDFVDGNTMVLTSRARIAREAAEKARRDI